MSIERAKEMIHQLANQLTVIMGNLDLAKHDPIKSPELIIKARKQAVEAVLLLRQLSHLLASIAEDAHKAALTAAAHAQDAALAAGLAVEQAETFKIAADELQRKTKAVKDSMNDLPRKKK